MQAIVATCAFGLGIKNQMSGMLFVMNCLPHFLLGHKSLAELDVMAISHLPTLILYSDNYIHHVGVWARGMDKQQRRNDIDDVAKQFSEGLSFSYAHAFGWKGKKKNIA